MPVISAGLLMYRIITKEPEYLLVHPGGPYFTNKNEGVWSIPKGIAEEQEDLLTTAQREFTEETGITPHPPFHPLGTVKLKSGKVVHAWAFGGEWDADRKIISNVFDLEWPPRSGQYVSTPEVDRAEWMNLEKARSMINPAQIPLLERAAEILMN